MLPKTAKVGGLTYDIEVVDGPVVSGDQVLYGRVDYAYGKIQICGLHSDDIQRTALVHELLHAIGYEREIKALFDEDLVVPLARALYAFMVDNGIKLPE